MHGDEPDLGERMKDELYLDPGFVPDRGGGLLDALENDIDETAERAKRAPKPDQPPE